MRMNACNVCVRVCVCIYPVIYPENGGSIWQPTSSYFTEIKKFDTCDTCHISLCIKPNSFSWYVQQWEGRITILMELYCDVIMIHNAMKWQFFLIHTIRQPEFSTWLDNWIKTEVLVKMLCPHQNCLSLYFRKAITCLSFWTIEDRSSFLCLI